jgi:hypothetical protein
LSKLFIYILVFTHARNASRRDLGYPFSCREAHRRKNSIERSTEYCRSKEGKEKKKYLNSNRSGQSRLPESSRDENDDHKFGSKIDNTTVYHIQMVTSLIEGAMLGSNDTGAQRN